MNERYVAVVDMIGWGFVCLAYALVGVVGGGVVGAGLAWWCDFLFG